MTEGPTELLPSAASAGPRLELPNGEAFNHADITSAASAQRHVATSPVATALSWRRISHRTICKNGLIFASPISTVKMAYCIIAYVASDYHQTGHNTQPFKPFSLSFFLILLIVVGR